MPQDIEVPAQGRREGGAVAPPLGHGRHPGLDRERHIDELWSEVYATR